MAPSTTPKGAISKQRRRRPIREGLALRCVWGFSSKVASWPKHEMGHKMANRCKWRNLVNWGHTVTIDKNHGQHRPFGQSASQQRPGGSLYHAADVNHRPKGSVSRPGILQSRYRQPRAGVRAVHWRLQSCLLCLYHFCWSVSMFFFCLSLNRVLGCFPSYLDADASSGSSPG